MVTEGLMRRLSLVQKKPAGKWKGKKPVTITSWLEGGVEGDSDSKCVTRRGFAYA